MNIIYIYKVLLLHQTNLQASESGNEIIEQSWPNITDRIPKNSITINKKKEGNSAIISAYEYTSRYKKKLKLNLLLRKKKGSVQSVPQIQMTRFPVQIDPPTQQTQLLKCSNFASLFVTAPKIKCSFSDQLLRHFSIYIFIFIFILLWNDLGNSRSSTVFEMFRAQSLVN